MKEKLITITETLTRTVLAKTENEDPKEYVEQLYGDSKIVLDSSDFSETVIEEADEATFNRYYNNETSGFDISPECIFTERCNMFTDYQEKLMIEIPKWFNETFYDRSINGYAASIGFDHNGKDTVNCFKITFPYMTLEQISIDIFVYNLIDSIQFLSLDELGKVLRNKTHVKMLQDFFEFAIIRPQLFNKAALAASINKINENISKIDLGDK